MHLLITAYFLLSLCGTMTSVAISLHFAANDGGPALISAILVSSACAQIFIAPQLAPLFDRYSARSIAIAATICEVVLLSSILVAPIAPVLIGVSLLSSALAGLSIPALFTIADEYGDEKNQAATFSLLDTARLVGSFAGPVLGGLLLDIWSLRAAISVEIAANAVTLAILLTLRHANPPLESEDESKPQSFLARALEAPALLLEQSRAALMSIWAAIIFTSVFSVALVFYAVDVLGAGGVGYAFLMQVLWSGAFSVRSVQRRPPRRGRSQFSQCAASSWASALRSLVFCTTWLWRLHVSSSRESAMHSKLLPFAWSLHPLCQQRCNPRHYLPWVRLTSAMLVGYIIGAPIVTAAGPALALVISGVGTALLTVLAPLVRNLRSRL